MRKLFILLLAFGCSESESEVKIDPVGKALYQRHVDDFYDRAEAEGLSVERKAPTVVFKAMDLVCETGNAPDYRYSRSNKEAFTIEIDDMLKELQNDQYFGSIIFRELAYMVLNKPYANQPSKENCPYNIMYPCSNIYEFENFNVKETAIDCLFAP